MTLTYAQEIEPVFSCFKYDDKKIEKYKKIFQGNCVLVANEIVKIVINVIDNYRNDTYMTNPIEIFYYKVFKCSGIEFNIPIEVTAILKNILIRGLNFKIITEIYLREKQPYDKRSASRSWVDSMTLDQLFLDKILREQFAIFGFGYDYSYTVVNIIENEKPLNISLEIKK